MKTPTVNSVTHPSSTHFLLFVFSILFAYACQRTEATAQELLKGFKATPNASVSSFQALLSDSTDTFSLGFLRVNSKELALAVLHVPSSEQLWLANPTQLAPWSDRTQLFFNGSLVLSGPRERLFWSTETQGDRVVLLNSSNLQVQKLDEYVSILWQSFYFPTNTLLENQNFTSNMSLVSSNGLYSMRLGSNFIGLYAKFNEKSDSGQIYLRHKALEAKANIIEGQGAIYARINSDRFLGMYQVGTIPPVDMLPFNSFQRNITGFVFLRLESDGNLKGYYRDGSKWILDYQAISDTCELPNPCGSYGLCRAGSGCSCIDNRTDYSSGSCFESTSSGDFCSEGEDDYWVLRRKGVELPFKELMRYEMTSYLEQCEDICEKNCSCWGAVFNNGSGFCYILDYPIQTLLGVGDESKMGYFKVREGAGKKKMDVGFGVGIGVLCGAIVVLIGAISFGSCKIWMRRRGVKQILEDEDGISPGPYKDLASASFRSIEMCNARR
ncbi:PAN domain-containing protein At5g03700 [Pistacia vera]|uniref:PAN domain-containing protein At5g03700 n=1 Tax=Pistacia vera TaxID=55513 RepID=UPI001262F17A|nr:PAN domain-containing protein At5g03700 [Pistacia vera]